MTYELNTALLALSAGTLIAIAGVALDAPLFFTALTALVVGFGIGVVRAVTR